jgi:DNA-binding IclR family transcriptional regulator
MSEGLVNGLLLVKYIARQAEPCAVSDAAREAGVSRSTAFRMVRDLEAAGWLIAHERGSTKRYSASLEVSRLGLLSLRANRIREVTLSNAIALSRAVRATCTVAFYERGNVIVTDSVDVLGERIVVALRGDRARAPLSASGKILLAHQGEEEIRRVVGDGSPAYTTFTKTKPEDIIAELAECKARGYGVANQDFRYGQGGVSFPIFDSSGHAVSAIGVRAAEPVTPEFVQRIVHDGRLHAAVASSELGYRTNMPYEVV